MSTLSNLQSRGVIDKEAKLSKDITSSKFRTYRRKEEDKVKSILRSDSESTEDSIDPYSKESSVKRIDKARVATIANSGYQVTLLEKILQSQNNPDLIKSNIQFQQKTVDLLMEVKDILSEIRSNSKPDEVKRANTEAKKREISDLAKSIAEFNVGGMMDAMKYSMSKGADRYGVMGLLGSVKDMVKSTLDNGMFGDMVKETIQDSFLSLLGDKNKMIIKSFKANPIETIQDIINNFGLSKNNAVSKLFKAHMTANKLDPSASKVDKDPNSASLFDVRTHTTINTVIPDMLSRLVAATEKSERVKYDHDKQKYMTVTQILEEYSNKDSVSKFTKDIINTARTLISEGADKTRSGYAYENIRKDHAGKAIKNSENKIMFKDDQAFILVMKRFASLGGNFTDLIDTDPVKVVKHFKLDSDVSTGRAVEIIKAVQDGIGNAPLSEVKEYSDDFGERRDKLNRIYESSDLTSDITNKEYRLFKDQRDGRVNSKDIVKELYGDVGPMVSMGVSVTKPRASSSSSKATPYKTYDELSRQSQKNNKFIDPSRYRFGTIQHRMDEFNISMNGVELNKEEERKLKIQNLYESNLINEKEYKNALANNISPTLQKKMDRTNLRLEAAYGLYAKFSMSGATAMDMAKLSNDPVGYWKGQGFFSNPTEVLSVINEDGTVNIARLQQRNEKFTSAYISDLDRKAKEAEDGKDINIDIGDPMGSVDNILDSVFGDPAITKKLGIGAGTVTGLALGKLINNKTFIKSPKLGWLLGAVGAGIMNMERTQNFLNQTLGATSKDGSGGYSNREILISKLMTKWLPSIGLGGKSAMMTYKFLSKLGPLGKILGPVGGLAVGGVVASMTPMLISKIFTDDGKGNKGILKKVGKALKHIPGVADLFGGDRDTRSDSEILSSSMDIILKKTDGRIAELEAKPNRTKYEESEYVKLKEYRAGLSNAYDQAKSITKIDDEEIKRTEMQRFRTSYLDNDEKVNQQYNADLVKRDRRNRLGNAADAKITIKTQDELAKDYATRELERYTNVDPELLNPAERRRYELLTNVSRNQSINDIFNRSMENYLDKQGDNIDDIADALYEGNSLTSKIGYSNIRDGWTDERGVFHKPLVDLNSREEFNAWMSSLPERSRNFVQRYVAKQRALYGFKDNLREIAAVSVDSTMPGLSPRDREVAIEKAILSGMTNSKNIVGFISNKYKVKKKDVVNKILSVMELGGVDSDDLAKENVYIDKIESLMGGGQGTKTNSIIKMNDLGKYKFKNGSKLSLAGCSVVAFNNAMNFIGIGGVSIDYLIDVANNFLTTDGGVTSDFFKEMSARLNLIFRTYNSIDNSFTTDMVAKFKPTSTKAVVLLLKNVSGDGSHYVNLRAINTKTAIIDDPEKMGTTDVSTSTLVASLLEVITMEKSGLGSTPKPNGEFTIKANPIGNMKTNIFSRVGNMVGLTKKPQIKTSVGGFINASSASSKPEDNVFNVRIVEDLTLPMKMTDKDAALVLSRKIRQGLSGKTEKLYAGRLEGIRKHSSVQKEFAESQRVQDDIKRTADAVAGTSTGKGGAGTGAGTTMGGPGANDRFSGLTNFKNGLLDKGDKSVNMLGALGALFMATTYGRKAVESVQNMFTKEDAVKGELDENGNEIKESHAADYSGNFSRARQYAGIAWNTVKGAGKFVKGIFGAGGKPITTAATVLDGFKNIGSKTSSLAAKSGDDILRIMKSMGPAIKSAPKTIKDMFLKYIMKVPVYGPKTYESVTGTPIGKRILGKFMKVLNSIARKFLVIFPKRFAEFAVKSLPLLSLVLTVAGLSVNLYEGYTKAHLFMNRDPSDVRWYHRVIVAIAKGIWSELPNILATILGTVAGPLVGAVGSIALIVLQDEFGDFEGLLKMLGLRDSDEEMAKEYNEAEEEQEANTADNVTVRNDGKLDVKLSDKKGVSVTMDPAKAKQKNADGTYTFTKDAIKNENANRIYKHLKPLADKHGVNASMAMSQWAQESAWGTATSEIARKNFVLFGIKAGKNWKGKRVAITTHEQIDSKDVGRYEKAGWKVMQILGNGKVLVQGQDYFRAYDSEEESVEDYIKFMKEKYPNGLDGYATDTRYMENVANLMTGNFNVSDGYNYEGMPSYYAQTTGDQKTTPIQGESTPGNYARLNTGFASPTMSPFVTSAFGMRWSQRQGKYAMHQGLDLRGNTGDPAQSIAPGVVTYVGNVRNGGNAVYIKHPDGTTSEYLHLSAIHVAKGDKITAGQRIGDIGGTGGYKPHLHLGIKGRDGKYIDPLLALGIDPSKIKTENSPENLQWMANNKSYMDNYQSEIAKMANMKVAKMRVDKNSMSDGVGGPEAPLPKPNKDLYKTQKTQTFINTSNDELMKQLKEQNNMLANALSKMTDLLQTIAKNSNENLNNTLETAMGLTK